LQGFLIVDNVSLEYDKRGNVMLKKRGREEAGEGGGSSQAKRPEARRDNPYVHARREWLERYGDYVSAARNWRLVALASCGVTALSLVANYHLATKSGTVPFVMEVDRTGHTFFAGVPRAANINEAAITKSALETWIRDSRSILADPYAERHYIDTVYAFLSKSSVAYRTLTSWYSDRQPFELAAKQTVDVVNINALPIGNERDTKTWTVTWDEVTTMADGSRSDPVKWRANITFERVPVSLADARIKDNPTGILITQYSWSQQ